MLHQSACTEQMTFDLPRLRLRRRPRREGEPGDQHGAPRRRCSSSIVSASAVVARLRPTGRVGAASYPLRMAFDLVLFGGTGDLTWRKLMPALFQAFRHGKLPDGGRILAISRQR